MHTIYVLAKYLTSVSPRHRTINDISEYEVHVQCSLVNNTKRLAQFFDLSDALQFAQVKANQLGLSVVVAESIKKFLEQVKVKK